MDVITEHIAVPGVVGELRHLHAFLGDFWARHALPPADAMRVELGLEEVFINVVTHGLEGMDAASQSVSVDLRLDDGALEVAIEDPGPPYDPLGQAPIADTSAGMETRRMGGLGVHLVRTLMDDVHYERHDGRNRFVMVARFARPAGPGPSVVG